MRYEDTSIEVKRLKELALRAGRSGRCSASKFLDPSLEREAVWAAGEAGAEIAFWGGYEDAERRVAMFYLEDVDSFPITALKCTWNARYASPSHRDLLGALMGLGIAREETGDIVVGTGMAYLFVLQEAAQYVQANLESAGKAHLKIVPADDLHELPEPEGEEIRETVASQRLDAVLAAGYNLSRAEAQRAVTSGGVKLNHVVETRADTQLEAGDLISCRGFGRLRVIEFPGLTRRGRLSVKLFRYGK